MARFGRAFPMPMRPLPLLPAFDAAGAGAGGSTSLSWSHTINGSAALVYLTCDTYTGYNVPPTVACSVGSTAMTQLGLVNYFYYSVNSFRIDFFVFGLLNPPQGLQTISASITGKPVNSGLSFANSVSYRTVLSFGTVLSVSGTVSSGSTTVSQIAASAGQPLLSQAFANYQTNFSGYNKNQRYLSNASSNGALSLVMGDAPTPNAAFSATMAYVNNSNYWGSLIVPMYA